MRELITAIQQVMPAVATEWNTVKLPLFQNMVETTFANYFAGKQTQEKTKMMAPVLDVIFARLVNAKLATFVVNQGNGLDYLYNNIPMECKITFGAGKSWSGNGYPKTPWHILLRFEVDDNGIITHTFATIVDLSTCQTKWLPGSKATNKTVNWYHLTFLSSDLDKLSCAVGFMQHTAKRSNKVLKYLQPVMV